MTSLRRGFTVSAALAVALTFTIEPAWTQEIEEVVVTARKREERLQDIPLAISAYSAEDIKKAGFQDLGDIALQTAGIVYDARSTNGLGGRINSNIRIRGAQVNSSLPHLQSSSLFIDGVFALGGINSMPLNDLERVEIIKGPQSAFFGRNTFAGAVNYITKTPSLEEFETTIDASAATYGQYEGSVLHSGPIIREKLGYQVNVRSFGRGSMFTANDGGELGHESTESISGVLYAEPNERLTIKLRAMYLKDDDGPPMTTMLKYNDYDTCTGKTFPGRRASDGSPFTIDFTNGRPVGADYASDDGQLAINFLCGKPPPLGSPQVPNITHETTLTPAIFAQTPAVLTTSSGLITPTDPNLLINRFIKQTFIPGVPFLDGYGMERTNRRVALTIDYEFEHGGTLSFVAGDNNQELNYLRDYDKQDAVGWYSVDPQTMDDESFDLRYTSNQEKRLRWSIGATTYEQEFVTSGAGGLAIVGCFSSCNALSGVFTLPPTAGDMADVSGLYGSVSFDFTDQLTLDVEARRMVDERTVSAAGFILSEEYKSTVPRVILSYKPNDSTNLYAQFSQGALPGRVNGLVATCSPDAFLLPFDDPLNPGTDITLSECDQLARQGAIGSTEVQELDAIEVGLKKILLDGRLSLNLSAYIWDWKNKPSGISVSWVRDAENIGDRDRLPPDPYFANSLGVTVGGSSEMKGAEIEASFLITDNWSVSGNISWTDTEWTDFTYETMLTIVGTSDMAGNQEPTVPKWQGSLSSTYTDQLNADWDWFARLDVIYQGDYYADNNNLSEGPAYTLTNIRLGLEKEDLRVELYGRNVLDEEAWRTMYSSIDFAFAPADFQFRRNWGAILSPQDKPTYGLRFNKSF